jgi:serine/threonine protein kinase
VRIQEIAFRDFDKFYIVMEYMDFELKSLINLKANRLKFLVSDVKILMKQLLSGLN